MQNTKQIDLDKVGTKLSKLVNKEKRHNSKSIKHWLKESVDSGNMRCYLNPDWKERWLPFIKYDWDWDFSFIDTLIAKKLKLIREFYSNDLKKNTKKFNTTNTNKKNKKIVKEIDEVLKLYEKYNNTTEAGEKENKLRIKFYQKFALLSCNWWD